VKESLVEEPIAQFWLKALLSSQTVYLSIEDHDKKALKALRAISF